MYIPHVFDRTGSMDSLLLLANHSLARVVARHTIFVTYSLHETGAAVPSSSCSVEYKSKRASLVLFLLIVEETEEHTTNDCQTTT